MKIFVIVRVETVVRERGFITEEAILATYTVSHPYPAFTNRDAALGFIEDLTLTLLNWSCYENRLH
jgi:hypothetical protein